MSKMKSNSGAARHFKKNAVGSFKRAKSHLCYILSKKSSEFDEKLEMYANDEPVRLGR